MMLVVYSFFPVFVRRFFYLLASFMQAKIIPKM